MRRSLCALPLLAGCVLQPVGDADQDGFAASVDCDDAQMEIHPGADERCDGLDDDCDGEVDEGATGGGALFYLDRDGDGAGDPDVAVAGCQAPEGFVPGAGDCDDTRPEVYAGAAERCDGEDTNCDGAAPGEADTDNDGQAPCAGDCDDADPEVREGAAERCDGKDNTCDGAIDEGLDLDGDGWLPCGAQPDCADADPSRHPGAAEKCDGVDQDCDGVIDEGFPDADGDGAASCNDCDDNDPARSPLGVERCNGVDDNCDAHVDEEDVCGCTTREWSTGTYLFCQDTASWSTAQQTCQGFGYHLVWIESEEENTWLAWSATLLSISDWWVGLSDQGAEGAFVWEDTSAPTFTAWAPQEPNNLDDEDCVQLYIDGSWNDKDCASPWFRYICELPPPP